MKNIIQKTGSLFADVTLIMKIKILLPALMFAVFSGNFTNANAQWQYVGDSLIFCFASDFFLTSNGSTPYVAIENNVEVLVKKFDGLNWVNVGTGWEAIGLQFNPIIALDGDTPYVSVLTFTTQGYTNYWGCIVFKLVNSTWTRLGIDTFYYRGGGDLSERQSLVMVDHVPYVAYSDETDTFKVVVKRFDGTSWLRVGTGELSPSNSNNQKLAYDGSDLFIAYANSTNGITVKRFDGTNWVNVGIPGFSGGSVGSISLAVSGNTPYVAFQDLANGSKTSVMKFDGSNWIYVGLPGFSDGNCFSVCLAFNGTTPFVSYHDREINSVMAVKKFDGSNWINVGQEGFFQDPYGLYASPYPNLTFINGIPYVAFARNYTAFCPNNSLYVVKFLDMPAPVELTSFVSQVNGTDVSLLWATGTETNNAGFEVERKSNDIWAKIGFVPGQGNTTSPAQYEFTDRHLETGTYSYRLKQIDFNGQFEYYELSTEVVIGVPERFAVHQNHPNPFNPVTMINYELPFDSKVTIRIYDITGRETATIVNDQMTAGYHSTVFNATNLPSGVYFYRVSAGQFEAVKRMMLIK